MLGHRRAASLWFQHFRSRPSAVGRGRKRAAATAASISPPRGGRTSGEQKAAACTALPLCFVCEFSSAHQAGLDGEKPDAGAREPDAQGAAVSSNTWLRVTKGKEAEGETYYHEIHYIRSALKELRGDFVLKPLNPRVI